MHWAGCGEQEYVWDSPPAELVEIFQSSLRPEIWALAASLFKRLSPWLSQIAPFSEPFPQNPSSTRYLHPRDCKALQSLKPAL